MQIVLSSIILFLSPLLVIYFILREQKFVDKILANKRALLPFLVGVHDHDAPARVRLRVGVALSLAVASGSLSAMLAASTCRTCPCAPVLIQALHYSLFIFGLIACTTDYDTVATTLLGFGIAVLGIGILVQLKTSAWAALLLLPLLCVEIVLFRAFGAFGGQSHDKAEEQACSACDISIS
jgi:hypothetical protein